MGQNDAVVTERTSPSQSDHSGGGSRAYGLGSLLFAGGVTGSLILAVSQFLTLFHTHVASRHAAVDTVTVGSAHSYAILPIALLAIFMAYGVWSAGSRPALLAVGLLGLIALLISLIRDLPDANKSGLRTIAQHYVLAANAPAIGLYMETLGAMILLIVSVSGFILIGSPSAVPASAPVAQPSD
jgi:hypothetical protein